MTFSLDACRSAQRRSSIDSSPRSPLARCSTNSTGRGRPSGPALSVSRVRNTSRTSTSAGSSGPLVPAIRRYVGTRSLMTAPCNNAKSASRSSSGHSTSTPAAASSWSGVRSNACASPASSAALNVLRTPDSSLAIVLRVNDGWPAWAQACASRTIDQPRSMRRASKPVSASRSTTSWQGTHTSHQRRSLNARGSDIARPAKDRVVGEVLLFQWRRLGFGVELVVPLDQVQDLPLGWRGEQGLRGRVRAVPAHRVVPAEGAVDSGHTDIVRVADYTTPTSHLQRRQPTTMRRIAVPSFIVGIWSVTEPGVAAGGCVQSLSGAPNEPDPPPEPPKANAEQPGLRVPLPPPPMSVVRLMSTPSGETFVIDSVPGTEPPKRMSTGPVIATSQLRLAHTP